MLPIHRIITETCRTMGVTLADLRSPSRMSQATRARRIIAHLARKHTNLSFPAIVDAVYADGRGHSSVVTHSDLFDRDADTLFKLGDDLTTLREVAERIEAACQAGGVE